MIYKCLLTPNPRYCMRMPLVTPQGIGSGTGEDDKKRKQTISAVV